MKIRRCPDCGGRLVAEIMEAEVKVRCNACGQELGTFNRADKPVTVSEGELYPLKPCPFCGGEADLHYLGQNVYVVHCSKCRAETDPYSGREDAIVAWNTRDSGVAIRTIVDTTMEDFLRRRREAS